VTTESSELVVSGIPVQVVRKSIKNLHLATYPPDGRVRIAVPLHVDDEAVRLAIASKLGWIRAQQASYAKQVRQSCREMVTGESHYVEGTRYRLRVIEETGKQGARIRGGNRIELTVRPGSTAAQRMDVLNRWHRERLRAGIPKIIEKWEPSVGVTVAEWGIKKMRTRWGTCNPEAARIWLNLELAKKPPECLEYIAVHEMVHLIERRHNDNFRAHMDRLMPLWRNHRDTLNSAPLGHEDWTY
jgi:predicted metal-dependent hydrolase